MQGCNGTMGAASWYMVCNLQSTWVQPAGTAVQLGDTLLHTG